MRKKKGKDEGTADWVVTYGDIMSLLLAFFVLLFSFSNIEEQKWKEIVLAFTGTAAAFYMPQKDDTIIDIDDNIQGVDKSIIEQIEEEQKDQPESEFNEEDTDKTEISNNEDEAENNEEESEEESEDESNLSNEDIEDMDKEFGILYNELKDYKDNNKYDIKFELIKNYNQIILRFDNELLFDSGKADLDVQSTSALGHIGGVILKYKDVIDRLEIEGNTDNVPINTEEFKDNFELSLKRALVVLYYFKDEVKFPPYKLIAVGYGEYNPVADNLTDANRAKNRRTDIVLIKNIKTGEEGNILYE